MANASLTADNGQPVAQGTPLKVSSSSFTDANGNPINKSTYAALLAAFPAPKPVKPAKKSLADQAKAAAGALLDKVAGSGGSQAQVTVPTAAAPRGMSGSTLIFAAGGLGAVGLLAYMLMRKHRVAKRRSRR